MVNEFILSVLMIAPNNNLVVKDETSLDKQFVGVSLEGTSETDESWSLLIKQCSGTNCTYKIKRNVKWSERNSQ